MATERTRLVYKQKTEHIFNALNGTKKVALPENHDWLIPIDNVLNYVMNNEKYKQTTKWDYLNSIMGYMRQLQEKGVAGLEPGIKRLQDENRVRWTLFKDPREENKTREVDLDEEGQCVIPPWETIKANISKIPLGKRSCRRRALYGLYTMILPRRLDDYRLMKVIVNPHERAIQNLPKDTNWLVVDTEMTPKMMIINVYKTAKSYGKWVLSEVDFPADLKEVLKIYLTEHKIKDHSYLFPKSSTEPNNHATEQAFSTAVADVFTAVNETKKKLCVRRLRVSAASYLCKLNPNYKTRASFASAMGHNINQQLLYNNVDIYNPYDILEEL